MATLEQIRRSYSNMPDARLLELAVGEAQDLRPDAIEVLKEELRSRGFGDAIEEAMAEQLAASDPILQSERISAFRESRCPICNRSGSALNAYPVAEVRSFLFFTSRTEEVVVGCFECIRATAAAANLWTLLLGWWSPAGVFFTPAALIKNLRAARARSDAQASEELRRFVAETAGVVSLLKSAEAEKEAELRPNRR